MKSHALFVVSKPLQFLVVLGILEQVKFDQISIIIVHNFFGSIDVYKRINENLNLNLKCNVHESKSSFDAIIFASNNNVSDLFIDSDVGFRKFLMLAFFKARNFRSSIGVFEEGIGTYRNDLYQGVKRKLFRLSGIGVNFGGCVFVSKIFIFSPSRYLKNVNANFNKVTEISYSINYILNKYKEFLLSIFPEFIPIRPVSKNAVVFISDWEFNQDILNRPNIENL